MTLDFLRGCCPKKLLREKKNESCGRGISRVRERVYLSKKLEVTCYAESFMAVRSGLFFGCAFHWSHSGRAFVCASKFGGPIGRNRRQRDAIRNTGGRFAGDSGRHSVRRSRNQTDAPRRGRAPRSARCFGGPI